MTTPTRLSGLGSPDVVPRLNDAWDPASVQMTPEDYFVLTRIDGRSSLKDIWTLTGFPEEKAAAILHKLREAGALLLPGDPPRKPKPEAIPETVTDPESASFTFNPVTYTGPLGKTIPADALDEAVLAEAVDLTDRQKRAILTKHQHVVRRDLLRILDVDPSADKKALKRAYFKISKDFHPDRFYGKDLGSYREKLAAIFETATQAFDLLTDDVRRSRYLGEASGPASDDVSQKAHASELFTNAVQLEVDGDLAGALKLFAAAIRLDVQPRYLRRAAEAAVRAQELRSAEEYAKKAAELDPRDASAHRTLAKVLRALGRPREARSELETAFRIEPANPHIAAELEEIRKLGG